MNNHQFSISNFISVFAVIITVFALSSCDSGPSESKIDFVGDSIVSRWDINQDFPSYLVYNYGVGGSGLELLKSYKSKFSDNDVVVISGTNDHLNFKEGRRNEYATKYIDAILSMTRGRIFLFSVLPRDFSGDRDNLNRDIEAFNLVVRDYVKTIDRVVYLDVYHDFIKGDGINMKYYSDGLHPNIFGYEILTQKLLKAL